MPTSNQYQPLAISDAEKKLSDQQPHANREAQLEVLMTEMGQLSETLAAESANLSAPISLAFATLSLKVAGLLLDLDRKTESWDYSRPTIDAFIFHQEFELAARACQYIYLAEQFDAIPAIGQAAWLAVTYPIDPQLTATVLDHIIEETPDDSDGAAVVAATAHYVVDIRSSDSEHEELRLFTGAMLARVARRHSNVTSQDQFSLWVERLELDQPEMFLVRLRNVVDVLVQTDWWFDHEALQSEIPVD